jgi:predicted transcriptional regulator
MDRQRQFRFTDSTPPRIVMTQLIAFRTLHMTKSEYKKSALPEGAVDPTSETRVMTAHIPLALAEQVDQIAARLERSRGWVIKQALVDWVAQEEQRSRFTREALAEVDNGILLDHQAVLDWADSLGTDQPLPPPSQLAR